MMLIVIYLTRKQTLWKEYYADMRRFAKSLISVGMEPHECVSIIGFNSAEWITAHNGIILAGGMSAGIYTTSNAESCLYVAEHSKSRVVVCDGVSQLEKFVSIAPKLPHLKALVIYNDVVPEGLKCSVPVHTFSDFLQVGVNIEDSVLDERMKAQKPGHCCTLIYTSGTTGNPKAVMLSHDNVTWTIFSVQETFKKVGIEFDNSMSLVSYLPLSHIAAQMFDIYLPIMAGVQVWFAQPDALKGSLGTTLKEVRPSLFFAVPRVWEKMMEKMISIGKHTTGLKKTLVTWAKGVGARKNELAQYGQSGGLPCGYTIANTLVFSKVKAALGLDRCLVCASGAAPISNDVINFFSAVDIPIYEFFGQSETTGPTAMCFLENWKVGTVGRKLDGTEMKVLPDTQELVYQGRNTMMGYLHAEKVTRETIDEDGYLHSGDCGKIDDDGFCSITGRIKELIITAGGENIPPVLIEDAIKEELPLLSNVMVIGDRRKFLTAIFTLKVVMDGDGNPTETLDKAVAASVLQGEASTSTNVSEAKECPKIKAYLEAGLKRANKKAASRAQYVQKYTIIDKDFSVNGNELTATLKLKRRIVMEKYMDVIEAMYRE
jgi:long-chain-fatty-acid--CoA ligase ACSBG